ncbi:MAG: peptide deformylase [Bacteriovoracaceae bacterium]
METVLESNKEYTLEGERLKIFTYPSPILKKKAKNVEVFDEDLQVLIKNMLYTMYLSPGIGLAAPQIGLSKRIFVIDTQYKRNKKLNAQGKEEIEYSNFNPMVFINPVLETSGDIINWEEGCLSVPGVYEEVKRKEFVKVHYQDIHGNPQVIEAKELLSICIQHENDHLDGIIFIEKLSLIKRNLVTKKFLKKKKS